MQYAKWVQGQVTAVGEVGICGECNKRKEQVNYYY